MYSHVHIFQTHSRVDSADQGRQHVNCIKAL